MNELYDAVAEVHRDLGRIEAKLDQALGLEERVKSLETSRSWLVGAASAISAVGTWFLAKMGIVA